MPENSYLGAEETPVVPPTSDEKTLALLSHVLTFFFPLLAPLIIYLVKKDESSFIAAHAKESLNFPDHCMHYLYCALYNSYWYFAVMDCGYCCGSTCNCATIRASEGKLYRYPLTSKVY
jgi:uncharacterized Tic20 family protein